MAYGTRMAIITGRKTRDVECCICHKPFQSKSKFATACPGCQKDRIARYVAKRHQDHMVSAKCKNCGKEFSYSEVGKKSDSKREFCHPTCIAKWRRKTSQFFGKCIVCGKKIENYDDTRYCSDRCRYDKDQMSKKIAINLIEAGVGDTISDSELLGLGFVSDEIKNLREKNPCYMFQESSWYRACDGAEYMGPSRNFIHRKGVSLLLVDSDRCRELIDAT